MTEQKANDCGHKENTVVAEQKVYDCGQKKSIVMAEHMVNGWFWPHTRCMIVSTLGVWF